MINIKVGLSSGTGKWNFYWAAMAAYKAGMLARFFTGVYYKNDLKTRLLSPVLPTNLKINRRTSMPDETVKSFYMPELYNAALSRMKLRNPILYSLTFQLYDLLTCHHLDQNLDIFHVRTGFGNKTIIKAKKQGCITITDFGGAHPSYVDETLGYEYSLIGKCYHSHPNYRLFRTDFDCSDHIFVNSEFVKETFRQFDPENHNKISVFYRGFDPARFSPNFQHREQRIERKQPFRVACMARIELNKGVQYLLEAWKQLQLSDAELVLIGHPGPPEEYDFLMSRYAGVFTHVPFVANNDLSNFYHDFDAWSLCSLTEGSSMSVYEAMACGLPCIVSENTGSVVRHGVDGYVHKIRDVEAIKAALMKFYDNRELCISMGQQARSYIADNYTWAHYQRKLVDAYRQLGKNACVA